MRLRTLSAAALVTVGLAACGASNSSDTVDDRAATSVPVTTAAPPASSTVVAPAPTTTTVTVPATTTTAPTATATTATLATVTTATITRPDSGGAGLNTTTTGTTACVAADLRATALPPNSAPGTTVLGITLANVGSGGCHTYGWPGVAFVNSSGSAVATLTTRSTHDVLGATPPTSFVIAPGQEASFRVTIHDAGGGTQAGCSEYSRLQIIAPDDTATLRVALPDGPVQSCGNVAVSAVEPGESATGQ